MSALKMDAMTYTYELDWALSSEQTIEASIRKLPFLEYPARRLYTILRIKHNPKQDVRRQDA